MAQHSAKHAAEVVDQFKSLIGDAATASIDDEHFAELQLMIESAIDTAVLMRLERIATDIRHLAEQVKHDAEHYG